MNTRKNKTSSDKPKTTAEVSSTPQDTKHKTQVKSTRNKIPAIRPGSPLPQHSATPAYSPTSTVASAHARQAQPRLFPTPSSPTNQPTHQPTPHHHRAAPSRPRTRQNGRNVHHLRPPGRLARRTFRPFPSHPRNPPTPAALPSPSPISKIQQTTSRHSSAHPLRPPLPYTTNGTANGNLNSKPTTNQPTANPPCSSPWPPSA